MNQLITKTCFFAGLFYILSGVTLGIAEPQLRENRNPFQPEISAFGKETSFSKNYTEDPTAKFLKDNPITDISGQLNEDEIKAIEGLMGDLLGVVNGPAGSPQSPAVESREEKSGNMVYRPISFLKIQYDQVKKKMREPDMETLLSGLRMKQTENTEKSEVLEFDSKTEIFPEIAGRTLVEIKLEITDQVVKANENFNLVRMHPFMNWLAAKGLPEEGEKVLMEAEAKRKAMTETVREAEKNGNRVYFIVNGKIVPFFFNIPLFEKGEYQLYILNDSNTPA